MRMVHLFKPYRIEQIGGEGVYADITDVASDGHVQVELWSGELLDADKVSLTSAVSRQRYAKRVADEHLAAVPDATKLAHLLGTAGVGLRQQQAKEQDDKREQADQVMPPELSAELRAQAGALLDQPDLLRRRLRLYRDMGHVGERKTMGALGLAADTRVLEKPVSVVVKGPSGSGKSYAVETILATLPTAAFVDYTTMSTHFLNYDTTPINHRIVALMEAPGLGSSQTPSGETAAYVVRSLISEGRIKTGTVERSEDGSGVEARTIVREGPAALWTTTTKVALDPELETRLLSFTVSDTEEQTKRVLSATADAYQGQAHAKPDLTVWHALGAILQEMAPVYVCIDFAGELAHMVDARQVRARRDFSKLLSLVAASAVLHHRQRRRDEHGRILADLADYRHVYILLADAFTAVAAHGCTPAVREAVKTVADLVAKGNGAAATTRHVADVLNIDRSAAQRRLAVALHQGWVTDENDGRRGKQRLLKTGDPLPEEQSALPDPDRVAAAHPTCAQAIWIDPLGHDDDVPPHPENNCTTAQVGDFGDATREEGAVEPVQSPVRSLFDTAQVGGDTDQGTVAGESTTCAVVQSFPGGVRTQSTTADDSPLVAVKRDVLKRARDAACPDVKSPDVVIVGGALIWTRWVNDATADRLAQALDCLVRLEGEEAR